jgi:membrane-associated phospholipid phosphatase
VQPSPCVIAAVNPFDRITFEFHSVFADFCSNLVQNGVAVMLFLLPLILIKDLRKVFHLEYFLLLGTCWNGAFLEVGRLLAQRPRALVFRDPMGDGANVNQYTSFYSGHTSFVSFATLSILFWLEAQYGRKHRYSKIALIGWVGLTTLTAVLRILGGRHYPSDTICGAVAGALVALVMWRRYSQTYFHDLDSI